jgi:methyl-accepting chemotaxis protein
MSPRRTLDYSLAGLLVLVLVIGVIGLNIHENRVESRARGHLQTMLMLRESVLRSYFESLRSEVALWSSRAIVIDLLDRLTTAHDAADDDALSQFGALQTDDIQTSSRRENTSLDNRIKAFADHHQYYDVFFIGPAGDILYTMAKESDFGTNLVDGPYADTGLGRLFRTLLASGDDLIAMEDFDRYEPSNGLPAAFLGAKVFFDDRFIGVYAIQIPEVPVNDIMQFSAGMGESGETYLVGEDRLMRSNSRFFDASTVLTTRVSGITVDKAFDGEQGLEVVDDYRGTPVYSAYRLFNFEGIRWAVLAEQDETEVRAPILSARLWLAGGFVLLCIIVLVLRLMLIKVVLPASLAAFLGLTLASTLDD